MDPHALRGVAGARRVLDVGAGLQLSSAPPAALLDLGVSKALNPYLSHPQTSTGNGLGAFSVRADAAISLPLVGDSKRGVADSETFTWKGPAHPVRVGLGGQMAVLPVEWLL